MNVLWLYEIPTFALGLLIVSVFIVLSVAGLRLTRPWVQKYASTYNDLANDYIAFVGVFYALLVGLIAVATWENYTGTEAVISDEAAAVADLYFDSAGYPPAVTDEVRETLRWYVKGVIEEEWAEQRRGIEPTRRASSRLSQTILHFEPTTMGQQVVHSECMRQVNDILTYRRLRLQAVDAGLPGLMWLVLLVGAAIAIGMTFFFWAESFRVHVLLTMALSAIIGLVIFVIFSLDRPLIGRMSVGPDSFVEVLEVVMEERPGS
jgi:hypothetical protein